MKAVDFQECCKLLYEGISAIKFDFENPKKWQKVTLKLASNHQHLSYKRQAEDKTDFFGRYFVTAQLLKFSKIS